MTNSLHSVAESYFGAELAQKLLPDFEIVEIAGGDWLFHQGDPGSALFLAVRGRLQVLKEKPDAEETTLLGEVTPGNSVGEVSLLTGEARSAGVRAIRDSLLIKIDRTNFDALTQKHPSLGLKLATNVADMLRRNGPQSPLSTPNAIAIVPLSNSKRIRVFLPLLAQQIEGYANSLHLTDTKLTEKGAPMNFEQLSGQPPELLTDWIHDQETTHPLLVYQCRAADEDWSRFATRQSDLVLFVADAEESPEPSDWETRLRGQNGIANGKQALVLLQPDSSHAIKETLQWLKHRRADYHLHVRADKPEDISRVARVLTGNALGLVLSGGGARGFAHLGVYKAMRELGIAIDWVGGASIGSIFGSPISADWDFETAYTASKHSFTKVKPFSDYTLPLVSLISGKRMVRELESQQNFQIEDLPIPFFCVSSILDSGELQVHEHGHLPAALRASASMPGVLPPAVVNQRITIDGAVLNCMPVDIMKSKPIGKIIAVDLTSHKSYLVDYTSMPSAWAILAGRLFPFFRKYRVPSISTTMLKATEIGTLAQVRQFGEMADLLIQPPVRQFGLTEVKAFDEIVNIGYQSAKEKLLEWLEDSSNNKYLT